MVLSTTQIELESIKLVQGIDFLVQALLGGLGLVAIASLFARLRHAREEEERQQIKVFTYAATVLASGVVLAYTIYEITGIQWILWLGLVLVIAGLIGVPIAVGIAVLRYHLYHIDLIINKTLVYLLLTLILAVLFELFIILLSSFFSELTHPESQNGESRRLVDVFAAQWHHLTESRKVAEDLAALAVAALFDPLRGRIQRFVDRHLSSGEESRTPPRSE